MNFAQLAWVISLSAIVFAQHCVAEHLFSTDVIHSTSISHVVANQTGRLLPQCDGAVFPCIHAYTNPKGTIALIEVCGNGSEGGTVKGEGIYLLLEKKLQKFDWFDKEFNRFSCIERGNDYDYYVIRENRKIKIVLTYRVNMIAGDYTLRVRKNRLVVLGKSRIDLV